MTGTGRSLGAWLWAVRRGFRWHRRSLLFLTSIYLVQVCTMYPDPVTEAELRPSVTNAGAVWWGPGARGPLTSGARRSYFYCPRLQCVWRDQVPLIVRHTGRWWTPVSRLGIVLLPPPPPLHSWPVSRHPVNGWMAARCPQLGTTAVPCRPPSPVNKLQQIHYPDKSMINCTFYIFSRNRSAVPNNGQSEKQRWFTPILNKPFDSIKPPPTPPGQTFVVQERSQQVQKQFWSFITFQWWHSPRPAPAPPRPDSCCSVRRLQVSGQCPVSTVSPAPTRGRKKTKDLSSAETRNQTCKWCLTMEKPAPC